MPRNTKSKKVSQVDQVINTNTNTQYYVPETEFYVDETPNDTDNHTDNDTGSDSDAESVVDVNADSGSDSDVDSKDINNVDTETNNKKKDKKHKESFENLSKRIDSSRIIIKSINKEINELEKTLRLKEKERNEQERNLNNTLKLIAKTHLDEVTKARKERPKRKGNINGGFNKEQPVPEILRVFLELPENTALPRPKVMSALHNKFTKMGLRTGQNIIIDKQTAIALELELQNSDEKIIKFTEFQKFLSKFYPPKNETEVVI
jgi:hypothetical protein